nr:hypothetical protein [Tanacetum cinerariifolium]
MTRYQQAVETLLSQGFIAKTDKNGVYDHGVLGMEVESNLIKLCEKVKEDAALEAKPGRIEVEAIGEDKEEAKKMKAALELQEDEIKDEVNCRNDKNIEELNGLKIHEDANGNSSNYVDLYVEDVETGKVYSVLNLISELGIHTMDELTKLSVKEVVDLIPTAIRHTLGNPYRISSFYNASKDPIKTKAAPPPAPPQCLFRFEESKQVVYTVNPSDKSGYLVDKKLWAPMYKHNSEPISFQNAISE